MQFIQEVILFAVLFIQKQQKLLLIYNLISQTWRHHHDPQNQMIHKANNNCIFGAAIY